MRRGRPAGALRGLRATSPTSTSAPACAAPDKVRKAVAVCCEEGIRSVPQYPVAQWNRLPRISAPLGTQKALCWPHWAHSLPVGRVKGLPLRLVCAASDADAVAPYAVE